MKILSWNVNGIRATLKKPYFIDWLKEQDADVVCIQEVKAKPEQIEGDPFAEFGYESYWHSAKRPGYSGLLTLTRVKPDRVEHLENSAFDDEGRWLLLDFNGLSVVNAYFPNSQPEGKRLDYKLAFCDEALKMCKKIQKRGDGFVLSGDYNIAHKAIDLKRPDENEASPGYFPQERAWMDKFTKAGFVDTFRAFEDGPDHYTWWSYRTRARDRNIGWRIDYHCINPELKPKLSKAYIQAETLGSDHCPVGVELDI